MATVTGTGGKTTLALAAYSKEATLHKNVIDRPQPNHTDVHVDIQFCGMCHSDLHSVNGDWGVNKFPLSPGHEAVGIVREVGKDVKKFKKGDRVGVGCFVRCCESCDECKGGNEQYCTKLVNTYASFFPEGFGHDECKGQYTNGGYTSDIVVNERWVFRIPDNLELKYAAPLLCAGATTYTPLARNFLGKGLSTVGIVGFGGLGHVAVKIAKAMGAKVWVFSRNKNKQKEADAIGAGLIAHSDATEMAKYARHFDVILDTVSESHDISPIVSTLKPLGTYTCLGGIPQPISISPFALIMSGYKIEGSLVASSPVTQDMLDFCSKHNILPDIELITASEASDAFKKLATGGAGAGRYVIDMSTLKDLPAYEEQKNE